MTLLREIAPFPVSGEPAEDREADSSTRTDALFPTARTSHVRGV